MASMIANCSAVSWRRRPRRRPRTPPRPPPPARAPAGRRGARRPSAPTRPCGRERRQPREPSPRARSLVVRDADVDAPVAKRRERAVELVVGSRPRPTVTSGAASPARSRVRPTRVRLKVRDRSPARRAVRAAARSVRVLEPVEQREGDAVRHREHLDALQRLGERRRLDRHHQQPDGLLELLHRLRSCCTEPSGASSSSAPCSRIAAAVSAARRRRRDGPPREPHGERPADGRPPRARATVAHACAGSVTRFTYRQSE